MQLLRTSMAAGFVAVLALSGCSSSDSGSPSTGAAPTTGLTTTHDAVGTRVRVSGRLEGVGGPAPQPPRPWPGSVSWTGPTHGSVRVGHSGGFRLLLPPGRYEVTGHSPRFGDGHYLCQAPHPLVVRPGAAVHLEVICQLR
jgi:hypothetical protein